MGQNRFLCYSKKQCRQFLEDFLVLEKLMMPARQAGNRISKGMRVARKFFSSLLAISLLPHPIRIFRGQGVMRRDVE